MTVFKVYDYHQTPILIFYSCISPSFWPYAFNHPEDEDVSTAKSGMESLNVGHRPGRRETAKGMASYLEQYPYH